MSRSEDVSTLRELSSTLSTIRTQTQGSKILRASTSLLRCMMFFDLCYLITGMSLITVGLTGSGNPNRQEQMIILGGVFGICASISALCNSLAAHGLRSWRRGFLVPWLMYYLVILGILVMYLARMFYFHALNLKQVFLFLSALMLFSCWRHLQKQFLLMAYPRPEQVVVDVEAVVRDLIGRSSSPATNAANPKDLPPKYEEVQEDLPPMYDPATMPAVVNISAAQGEVAGAVGGPVVQLPPPALAGGVSHKQ
jgi:hypothetical protein